MASAVKDLPVVGRNGVVITRRPKTSGKGYRTYEVHQRERVGESTEKIKPAQLASDDYRRDPYPLLKILRENYPCFRDWSGNSYWTTQYNDVTSLFADEANFETRSKLWYYELEGFGRDLRAELPVLEAQAQRIDAFAESVAEEVVGSFANTGAADLATQFAARYPLELLNKVLDLPDALVGDFATLYWRMQRGTSWDPALQSSGQQALNDMVALLEPLVAERRQNPAEDLISAIVTLDLEGGPAGAADVVTTLLEGDHETLHGSLANLFFLLLANPEEFAKARSERRLLKLAYLETLRHSTPVLSAQRFARHEVERFGRLLPEGALMICSAAAANRDPRVFKDPDRFIVDRKDLCQREPRGMYRADGLASGITFGLGKPSKHPAIPEDRPRSLYAITRDTAVTASEVLLRELDNLQLAPGADPYLTALRVGEMHTCWKLPVTFANKS